MQKVSGQGPRRGSHVISGWPAAPARSLQVPRFPLIFKRFGPFPHPMGADSGPGTALAKATGRNLSDFLAYAAPALLIRPSGQINPPGLAEALAHDQGLSLFMDQDRAASGPYCQSICPWRRTKPTPVAMDHT